jgi:SAM-dependent methyltransferase
MSKINSGEWFKEWFNSPYYHILYNHRDEVEANQFIDHLIGYLKPEKDSKLLDMACGRGRHAIYLSKHNFDVTGVDLSKESIRFASAFESENLHFFVHDMRNLLFTNYFDYVLNLFTSFGYFERVSENQRSIVNMARALKPGGKLILDFVNVEHILKLGSSNETKSIEGIVFNISKQVKGERVIKSIQFEAEGKSFNFEEKVMLLKPLDFETYFNFAGLNIKAVFGDYELNGFNPEDSERLIYIVEKNA